MIAGLNDEPYIANGCGVLFDLFKFSSQVVPHLSRFASGDSEQLSHLTSEMTLFLSRI